MMGHGYKEDTGHYHKVTENLPDVITSYPLKNGYFGVRGKGRLWIRNIKSKNPVATALDFYRRIAKGGQETELKSKNGFMTKMKDGTIISWRETSSSDGTPAVDINIKHSNEHGELKYQKIHFVKGVENNEKS